METRTKKCDLIIAAGGTGGHLFPAQALSRTLLKEKPECQVTFIAAGLQTSPYFDRGSFPFLEVKSGTPYGKNPFKIAQNILNILRGTLKAYLYMKRVKPELVIGFGSFHSFPALLAARLLKVPIVLFESNAHPGRVNRFTSRWAQLALIQFSKAEEFLRCKCALVHFNRGLEEKIDPEAARRYFGLAPNHFTFVIIGGSQGALRLNQIVADAMAQLKSRGASFQLLHLVGKKSSPDLIASFYHQRGIKASVKEFEEKMNYLYSAADLAICRAGASTISELIEFELPSILIPFPYGSENHQYVNSRVISTEIQGGLTLDEKRLDGSLLERELLHLMNSSKEELQEMKKRLKAWKQKEKKEDLCSIILKLI